MQMLPAPPRPRTSSGIYLLVLGAIALFMAVPLLRSLPAPVAELSSGASTVTSALDQLPLAFVPNQGQSETAVLFEAHGADPAITFTAQEIRLQIEEHPLHLSFVGANQAPVVAADTMLPGKINDFRGNDPAQWFTKLPTYAGISYQALYPGIDVRYQGADGSLKSTFTVAPDADPARIRWQYSSIKAAAVNDGNGDLLVTLPDQTQLVEKAPVAWQEIDGQRISVPVAYALAEDGSIGFELGRYDSSATLVIDPTIVYETNVDLGSFDRGHDIVIDASGNAYVLGLLIDASNDVFVAKLSPDGALLYVTYLGGSSVDFGGGIALDGSGDVYLGGATDSTDFPILNAWQSEKNGVTREGFITKLAGDDGSLQFSTYFGGSRSDTIYDLTLNGAGEIYLVGYTESTDFPTLNPIQGGLNLTQCFCEDTFVTKLTPDALTLLYSTYLGGSFEDYGQSIALDSQDNIYITGRTQSDDYPTQAAIQPNRAGQYQDEDVFVTKIASDGSQLVYSTYLGGTENDSVRRIAVDGAGNAFVAGSTRSVDFPTTAGAFQEEYVGGILDCGTAGFGGPVNCEDMFVTKLVPDGSSLAYSTYVGGGLADYAQGVAINESGEAFVIGYTGSADFPGLTGSEPAGIALVKLNASGSDHLYTTIIESATANAGHGIAVDTAGAVYITASKPDLLVAKIADDGAPPPPPPTPTPTPTPIPPTPTPMPTADALHSGDLDSRIRVNTSRQIWRAYAIVRIHDGDHNPVGNATVYGTWDVGDRTAGLCTTNSRGRCTVSSDRLPLNVSQATFTLTDVDHTDLTYDPIQNHDPDGDSDGTTLTVVGPAVVSITAP